MSARGHSRFRGLLAGGLVCLGSQNSAGSESPAWPAAPPPPREAGTTRAPIRLASSDLPVLVSPVIGNGRLEFTLQGAVGQAYAVERSADLSMWIEDPTAEVVLVSPATSAVVQVPMDGAPQQFVRVRLKGAAPSPEVWDDVSAQAGIIIATRQDWGVLGLGTAAYTPPVPGPTLRIGDHDYVRGLGHHANGGILLLLDGAYDRFEAEVGPQPCPGGSVIFRAYVDGQQRFDSGVMRSGSGPWPVALEVDGGYELLLETTDAGDGIGCDVANWANARLRRSPAGPILVGDPRVDVGLSAQVATWDPGWMEGSRADISEEFPEGDVFLETEVPPDALGHYTVPVSTNQLACIGLEWFNRRALRELRLDFVDPADVPPRDAIRVEGWFGASRWHGDWSPLEGELVREGDGLVFQVSRRTPPGCGLAGCLEGFSGSDSAPLMTRKLRWVWPAAGESPRVKHPGATTRSRWATTEVQIEVADDTGPLEAELWLEDGAWISPATVSVPDRRNHHVPGHRLGAGQTATFSLRHALPSVLRSDLTKIHARRGAEALAILVEDVLTQPCVYVRELGILVCRADAPIRLADYRQRIAGRRTLLEQVRSLPDQTREQAMARTHRVAQNEGPVMLSLVAENDKILSSRTGEISFHATELPKFPYLADASELVLRLHTPSVRWRSRSLDGGWLPIPVIEHEAANAVLTQRAFVAPIDADEPDPARLGRQSVCVVDFGVRRLADSGALPEVTLTFRPNSPAVIEPAAYGFVMHNGGRPLAHVVRHGTGGGLPSLFGTTLTFPGEALLPDGGRWAVYILPASRDVELPLPFPEPQALRAAAETYWSAVLNQAAQVDTPDPFLNDLIRSLRVRCLIAARTDLTNGTFAPWVAAMHYGPRYLDCESYAVVRGMDHLGHADFARRAIEYLMHRYTASGFLTTGYTTYGTSRHLESVAEHYRLTGDRSWLAEHASEFKRVCEWIVRQTQKTRRALPTPDGLRRAAGYGLMPPAVLADSSAFGMHFSLNGYYASALRGIGEALETLGDPAGASLRAEAAQLAARTAEEWRNTARQAQVVPLRNGEWVAYYPSQIHAPGPAGDFSPPLVKSDGFVFLQLPSAGVRNMMAFFAGEDAGRSWAYDVELGSHHLVPTGVVAPDDPRVGDMLNHLEDVQFLTDGWFDYPAVENERDWFDLGGFSKVQPHYTRNCDLYALRDDVKPFLRSYFNSMAAMVNPEVLTFWEHFQHTGAWDKTHEAGQFLHQTRTMLLHERGNALWLAPLIPTNWLQHGMTVAVTRAPTRFGQVSYWLTSHVAEDRISALVDAPLGPDLRAVILRARHPAGQPMRAVTVNGLDHAGFDLATETVQLPAGVRHLQVELHYSGAGVIP